MKTPFKVFFLFISDELHAIADKVLNYYDKIHICYDVDSFTTFKWVYTTIKNKHNLYFIFLQH